MASYFNLTLDTLAPEGLTLAINDGALYTTSVTVKLTVGLTDEATSGYQMKIWGIDGVAEEAAASWETYAATKSVTLTEGDGLKTVFIKVRDDVGNETGAASDTITLNTAVPVVTVTGPDKSRISKTAGFNQSIFNFTADVAFAEYKVCVVPANSSTQDAGTVIPTTAGIEQHQRQCGELSGGDQHPGDHHRHGSGDGLAGRWRQDRQGIRKE